MFDFTTATSAPVTPVRINGKEYQFPHFLLPRINVWAAKRSASIMDEAVNHYKNDDDKAKFKRYYPRPMIDIIEVRPWATSTEGAPVVVRECGEAAGVPSDVLDAMIAQCDPEVIRDLAEQLISAATAEAIGKGLTEPSIDPLAKPAGGSQDSLGTGESNTPDSAPATQESTQAA